MRGMGLSLQRRNSRRQFLTPVLRARTARHVEAASPSGKGGRFCHLHEDSPSLASGEHQLDIGQAVPRLWGSLPNSHSSTGHPRLQTFIAMTETCLEPSAALSFW